MSTIETMEGKPIELVFLPYENKHSEKSIVGQASNARNSSPPISLDITKAQSTFNSFQTFLLLGDICSLTLQPKTTASLRVCKFVIRIQLMATLSTAVKV